MTVKVGQIYKQKSKPIWRKYEDDIFVISCIGYNIHTIYLSGIVDYTSMESWIKGDCELIAEYPSWQEAVNSPEFKGVRSNENV